MKAAVRLVGAVCGIAALVPGTASAQDSEPLEGTGTRVGSKAAMVYRADNSKLGDNEVRARPRADADNLTTLHTMATCVVRRRPAYATGFLAAAPQSADAAAALNKMNEVMSRCLGAQAPMRSTTMALTGPLWLGALAEAMMQAMPAADAPAATSVRPSYTASWMENGDRAVVDEMAVCLADMQPSLVHAVFATLPASPQERAAVTALAPFEGVCLRRGATLRTNIVGLRASLAVAAYHRRADGAAAAPMQTVEKK